MLLLWQLSWCVFLYLFPSSFYIYSIWERQRVPSIGSHDPPQHFQATMTTNVHVPAGHRQTQGPNSCLPHGCLRQCCATAACGLPYLLLPLLLLSFYLFCINDRECMCTHEKDERKAPSQGLITPQSSSSTPNSWFCCIDCYQGETAGLSYVPIPAHCSSDKALNRERKN